MTVRPLILLTNDDGIDSPGLHAVATAVTDLGDLLIIAPSSQQTSTGRSHPPIADKAIYATQIPIKRNGKEQHDYHLAYKAAVSPAQSVALAVHDLANRPIDLCISGINYGENIGSGVTISGTVGAAIEAISYNIPALAMSFQTPPEFYLTNSNQVDFSVAAYFTHYFAQQILTKGLPDGVDLLKVDVPASATRQTAWRTARISRQRYYFSMPSGRTRLDEQKELGYKIEFDEQSLEPDSDIYVFAVEKLVSVVPMTIDLTASVSLNSLAKFFTTNL